MLIDYLFRTVFARPQFQTKKHLPVDSLLDIIENIGKKNIRGNNEEHAVLLLFVTVNLIIMVN